MALTDNLSYYYKLDETSGSFIDSNSNQNLVASGSIHGPAGKIGNCTSFANARTSDIAYTSNNSGFTGSSAATIACWVKVTDATEDSYICDLSNTGGGTGFALKVATERARVDYFGGTVANSTNLSDNTWTHIVFRYDGSSSWSFYINGAADGTGSRTFTNTNAKVQIGQKWAFLGFDTCMNGNIDEVGIWNRVLTPTEISTLYNSGAGLSYPFTTSLGFKINVGDVWKDVSAIKINVGDAWKSVSAAKINIGDVWKTIF